VIDRTGIQTRLDALGLTLPIPPALVAAYDATRVIGDQVYVSGQIPLCDGSLRHVGRVGVELDLQAGRDAARQCAVNALAQLQAAVENLDRIRALSAVTVYVAETPGFAKLHLVADEASHLLAAVLGDAGHHSRTVVGVAGLPLGAPVELTLAAAVASEVAGEGA
jgi:enamine deaminase RidA (YjgF/YER057c/UK114 family)